MNAHVANTARAVNSKVQSKVTFKTKNKTVANNELVEASYSFEKTALNQAPNTAVSQEELVSFSTDELQAYQQH